MSGRLQKTITRARTVLIASTPGMFVAMGLSGCSVINVYDQGSLVNRYYGLPIYIIDTAAPHTTLFMDIMGVGVINNPTGYSIGYSKQTFLSLPTDRCTAVFINPRTETISVLKNILEASGTTLDTLCFYSNQGARLE